jgi:hypothetical protein
MHVKLKFLVSIPRSAVGAEANDNTKGSTQTYWNASRRSDKHAALQDNANDEIELSTPLGSFFTFCRQTRSFIPSCGET